MVEVMPSSRYPRREDVGPPTDSVCSQWQPSYKGRRKKPDLFQRSAVQSSVSPEQSISPSTNAR